MVISIVMLNYQRVCHTLSYYHRPGFNFALQPRDIGRKKSKNHQPKGRENEGRMPSRPNDFDLWAEGLARVLVSPARAKALLQCQKRLDLTQQYTVAAVELSVTFMEHLLLPRETN